VSITRQAWRAYNAARPGIRCDQGQKAPRQLPLPWRFQEQQGFIAFKRGIQAGSQSFDELLESKYLPHWMKMDLENKESERHSLIHPGFLSRA
jgi:hypothetical protein